MGLVEQLEHNDFSGLEAIEAGPDMDNAVAFYVFGANASFPPPPDGYEIPPYSTNMAAAWQIIEHFGNYELYRFNDNSWHGCKLKARTAGNSDAEGNAAGDTPMMAICRAAIIAAVRGWWQA